MSVSPPPGTAPGTQEAKYLSREDGPDRTATGPKFPAHPFGCQLSSREHGSLSTFSQGQVPYPLDTTKMHLPVTGLHQPGTCR
jgi:hypothetical protein